MAIIMAVAVMISGSNAVYASKDMETQELPGAPLATEEELEVGKIYTVVSAEIDKVKKYVYRYFDPETFLDSMGEYMKVVTQDELLDYASGDTGYGPPPDRRHVSHSLR